MRKKLLTIMFALLMCFSTFVLTACGAGGGAPGGSGDGSSTGGGELR